jgi:hypothetical protein
MTAIIVHSVSKHKRSLAIAKQFEGDVYEIQSKKRTIQFYPFQLAFYGFLTVANRFVPIHEVQIDYDKYDHIVLISPVWAGRVNAFMRQFLKNHPFNGKKVTLVASCDGGCSNYFESFDGLIDDSNTIVDKQVYIKGVKQ